MTSAPFIARPRISSGYDPSLAIQIPILPISVSATGKKASLVVSGEDVELTMKLTAPLGRVSADPGQIEQVVLNLAVNARDTMPNGGKLTTETANVVLDDSTITSHVKRIRRKFVATDANFDAIHTVYGMGYRWLESE